MNEGLLSVKNASGRHVSLLNSNDEPHQINVSTSPSSTSSAPEEWQQSKRKYHCTEPGCNKSFTTSGHLARHNRIHTGEKNFPCLFPGCQSRFSRQDNMMQHYRTHMSPKSRRSQKRGVAEEARPRPRLHAHHRIRSDPVQVEPPLTIDQHLSNYHQSLRAIPAPPNGLDTTKREEIVRESSKPPSNMFYQHRPLTFTRPQSTNFPYTLLHPAQQQKQQQQESSNVVRNQDSGNNNRKDDPMDEDDSNNETKSSSNRGLLQLAHIVSTFG
ncbi:hypothetical protein BD560DRAFT_367591 [Blakeslea trispora]|nr:hypothetical protein BD560DRAFT_367591 [Blakeslea trispora]